jgi:sulfur carrier protein ThiS
MLVKVRSYGLMGKYTSHLSAGGELQIPDGSKVADVLAVLKVPQDAMLVLLVNGRAADPERVLLPRDTLVFFPPLEGG